MAVVLILSALVLPGYETWAETNQARIVVKAGISGHLTPLVDPSRKLPAAGGLFPVDGILGDPTPLIVTYDLKEMSLPPGKYWAEAKSASSRDFSASVSKSFSFNGSPVLLELPVDVSGFDGERLEVVALIRDNAGKTVYGPENLAVVALDSSRLYMLAVCEPETDSPETLSERGLTISVFRIAPDEMPGTARPLKDFAGVSLTPGSWNAMRSEAKAAVGALPLYGVPVVFCGKIPDEMRETRRVFSCGDSLESALRLVLKLASDSIARLNAPSSSLVGDAAISKAETILQPTYAVDIRPPVVPQLIHLGDIGLTLSNLEKVSRRPNLEFLAARYLLERTNLPAQKVLSESIVSESGQPLSVPSDYSMKTNGRVRSRAILGTAAAIILAAIGAPLAFIMRGVRGFIAGAILLAGSAIAISGAKATPLPKTVTSIVQDATINSKLVTRMAYFVGPIDTLIEIPHDEKIAGVGILKFDDSFADNAWSYELTERGVVVKSPASFLELTRVEVRTESSGKFPINIEEVADGVPRRIAFHNGSEQALSEVFVAEGDRLISLGNITPGETVEVEIVPPQPSTLWRTVGIITSGSDPVFWMLGTMYKNRLGRLARQEQADNGPHVFGVARPIKDVSLMDVLRSFGGTGTIFASRYVGAPWGLAGFESDTSDLTIIEHCGAADSVSGNES
ncbi:MAG: hypothetical protein HRF49_11070 [bacterium]